MFVYIFYARYNRVIYVTKLSRFPVGFCTKNQPTCALINTKNWRLWCVFEIVFFEVNDICCHTHTCAFRQVRLNSRSSHNVSPQSHNRSTRVHVLHIFGTNSLRTHVDSLSLLQAFYIHLTYFEFDGVSSHWRQVERRRPLRDKWDNVRVNAMIPCNLIESTIQRT